MTSENQRTLEQAYRSAVSGLCGRLRSNYDGMVLAPFHKVNFSPDLTMICCNASQLRHMLFALMPKNGRRVTSTLDPTWSCVHSIVPSLLNGTCEVTVPNPGDFGRASVGDDEMIFTVPVGKMKEFMDIVYHYEKMGMGIAVLAANSRAIFNNHPSISNISKSGPGYAGIGELRILALDY
jgi:uncharacterized protein (DUF169 family)